MSTNQCPRCGNQELRPWQDLNDDERDVVRRLPASANFQKKEREAKHRWCTRCWYEQTGTEQRA
ncbi:MAG TPA: hypothetical protein VJT50_12195 [Pyrinomonadaceae bacterium]|nr:hypothetical protein [Pyrinomonadaceae bacterium]